MQALPNIHTTLGDHPHPASRPMTLGHFTSWRADDRGYYTGVGFTPQTDHARAAVRACGPRGIFCKGFVPSARDRSIASAPRGDMKSLDLAEFLRFLWLSYDFSESARGGTLQNF